MSCNYCRLELIEWQVFLCIFGVERAAKIVVLCWTSGTYCQLLYKNFVPQSLCESFFQRLNPPPNQ